MRLTCVTARGVGPRGCSASRSLPFHLYERRLLETILALLDKVPSKPTKADQTMQVQLKETRGAITRLEKQREVLFSGDVTTFDRITAQDYRETNAKLLALQEKELRLINQIKAKATPNRDKMLNKFLRQYVASGCRLDDVEARLTLRGMLARLDYHIVTDPNDSLHVTVGNSKPVTIKRPPAQTRGPRNPLGLTGVTWDKARGKYVVRFRNKPYGRFDRIEDAVAKRKEVEATNSR